MASIQWIRSFLSFIYESAFRAFRKSREFRFHINIQNANPILSQTWSWAKCVTFLILNRKLCTDFASNLSNQHTLINYSNQSVWKSKWWSDRKRNTRYVNWNERMKCERTISGHLYALKRTTNFVRRNQILKHTMIFLKQYISNR